MGDAMQVEIARLERDCARANAELATALYLLRRGLRTNFDGPTEMEIRAFLADPQRAAGTEELRPGVYVMRDVRSVFDDVTDLREDMNKIMEHAADLEEAVAAYEQDIPGYVTTAKAVDVVVKLQASLTTALSLLRRHEFDEDDRCPECLMPSMPGRENGGHVANCELHLLLAQHPEKP